MKSRFLGIHRVSNFQCSVEAKKGPRASHSAGSQIRGIRFTVCCVVSWYTYLVV